MLGDEGRSGPGGRFGGGGSDLKCYECGEFGHYARECRNHSGSGRRQNRTPPRYRRGPSYGRSPRRRSPRWRSISPRQRSLSRSPPSRRRSPRRRSVSPRRRSHSKSPPSRGGEDVKHDNRNGLRDRQRNRS